MRAFATAIVIFLLTLGGAARADEIADVLEQIYKPYLDPSVGFTLLEDNPHLSSRLKALYAEYLRNSSPDEVGPLDFDPFISAQDYQLKDLSIKSQAISGDTATVVVEFMNFDYWTELTYSFVRENGAWRVDDIRSDDDQYPWVLSAILTSN
jgi:hypothetical protein